MKYVQYDMIYKVEWSVGRQLTNSGISLNIKYFVFNGPFAHETHNLSSEALGYSNEFSKVWFL